MCAARRRYRRQRKTRPVPAGLAPFIPFGPELEGRPALQWLALFIAVACSVYVAVYLAIA